MQKNRATPHPASPAAPAPPSARSTGASAHREGEPRSASRRSGPPSSPQRTRRTIDLGTIDDLRILSTDGTADGALDPRLTDTELLRIHKAMVLTRKFDERMLRMQRQGQMGTFAPGSGQEATQIGQVYPLTERDWFAPSYRSFGAQIWRGWEMERLLLLWDGYFEGFAPPPGLNDLPFSIVIGSHVLPAVGIAMAHQYRRKEGAEEGVVLANFGDGATSQGAVSEALNFAAVYKAPIVFVCENNGWAISMPASEQAAVAELARRGPGFGMPAIRVDGNDVLAVIVATTEAVERARAGEGPTFIETVTYRMSVHTTADDPKVYRRDDEVEAWRERCPIVRFERYLASRKVLDEAGAARVADDCEREVLEARDRFQARAKARPREVFDFVYERLTTELEEQKREYLEKLDRKGVE